MEEDKSIKNKNKFELNVAFSNRVRKGTIKVSDKDISNIGVDIVDNVVVNPIGKKEGVSEMLFSDSKIKSGFILMNPNDGQLIDLEEGDRVTIESLQKAPAILKPNSLDKNKKIINSTETVIKLNNKTQDVINNLNNPIGDI